MVGPAGFNCHYLIHQVCEGKLNWLKILKFSVGRRRNRCKIHLYNYTFYKNTRYLDISSVLCSVKEEEVEEAARGYNTETRPLLYLIVF